ncbi:MAG TPA: macrolide transporter [Elusimicrobia bacterium]|nr:macrolide transporter [Elusimicrobiota bacterium]
MNVKKILIVSAAVAVCAAGAWLLRGRFTKTERGRAARVVTASLGPIEEAVEASGGVAPLNRVEIKPPISGRIEQLLVEEGTTVKAGQILAWMSSSDRAAILDAARAKGPDELKKWQDSYKPTPIIAPLSGVIILRNTVVGQAVDGGTILFAMSDTLIVVAQVDESSIGRIRKGLPCRITLDSYPDKTVQGTVFDILHEGKNVSNVITYGVKVKPETVPPFFRSQMTANVSFILHRKEDAVLVPSAAVQESRDGGKFVLVKGEEGKPERLPVQTGVESGDKVEIVSGLAEGDEILLSQGRYRPQQAAQSSPLLPSMPGRQSRGGRSTGGGGGPPPP